ncbi:MAG: GNAT family N-acetyltransferase [Armatimonadetes bacterium]|nr:GNAT family N-acetyltransferase [Armatimonadota bacterium]
MVETYFALARPADGLTRFEDDGVIGCRSTQKHPASNFSVVARPNIHSLTRLVQMDSHTVYVLPTDQTYAVIEMMKKVGFTPGRSLSLMFVRNPLGGIDLDLTTVTGISARYDHTMFLAKQFFSAANMAFCEGIATLTSRAPECELICLGRLEAPTAGAMISQTNGTLGLYNISVTPEQRHRGLGGELVRALVGIAASRRCTATLQCHDSLVPWYERLGFRKYAEVVMMRREK